MLQRDSYTSWLLSASTPTIRYLTMVDLLEYHEDDPRVVEARQAIMNQGTVPAILSHQTEKGVWEGERSYYTPKYTSTHWSLLLLSLLNVDAQDARFQKGVRYMLETTARELSEQISNHQGGLSCFWGNMVRYAFHAGLEEDDRVKEAVRFIAWDLSEGLCRCSYNSGHPCAWGVVRTLWALAAVTESNRTPEMHLAIDRGVEFLLDSYDLVDANYPIPENGRVNRLWAKLSFPLFYQADILFTLYVLDELGQLDNPGARPALEWLRRRRKRNGHWPAGSPFRLRTWLELGDHEEIERWVSLFASRILLHAPS